MNHLTPDDVAELEHAEPTDRADLVAYCINGAEAPDFARAAALALHGQPFGFTQEDVTMLRLMPDGTGYASIDDPQRYASLIARLAALLPPEST